MNTLNAALKYLSAKIAPIPIWRDEGKNPKITRTQEFNSELPTVDQIERWFTRWPDANIGLITGYWQLCALDFDDQASFDAWVSQGQWDYIAPTWVVSTGRGFHVWFRVVGEIGPSTNYTYQNHHILARCRGGYCIAPPSMHHTGRKYETVVNAVPAPIDSIEDVLDGWEIWRPAAPQAQNRPILPQTGQIRLEDLIPIPENSKRAGRHNAYQIPCPFSQNHQHGDRRPSGWLNVEQQRFGCNSCWPGQWWDAANVYAMLFGVTNDEAYEAVNR